MSEAALAEDHVDGHFDVRAVPPGVPVTRASIILVGHEPQRDRGLRTVEANGFRLASVDQLARIKDFILQAVVAHEPPTNEVLHPLVAAISVLEDIETGGANG